MGNMSSARVVRWRLRIFAVAYVAGDEYLAATRPSALTAAMMRSMFSYQTNAFSYEKSEPMGPTRTRTDTAGWRIHHEHTMASGVCVCTHAEHVVQRS